MCNQLQKCEPGSDVYSNSYEKKNGNISYATKESGKSIAQSTRLMPLPVKRHKLLD